MMTTMMRIFRIHNIILPLLALLAVIATPEAEATPVTPGNDNRRVVEIGSAQQYIDFVKAVNSGEYDLSARLTADIDLTGKNVSPIGSFSHSYVGFFDGKGHVISNMKIEWPSADRVGMFGRIGPGAHICNFILDKPTFSGKNHVGIVAECYNSIDKLTIIENIGFNDGYSKAITDDKNDGGNNAGGILGRAYGLLEVRNCFVTGTIEGRNSISSVCAFNDKKPTFINCWANATVKAEIADNDTFTHGACTLINCRDNNAGNGLIAPDENYYKALVEAGSWKDGSTFGHIIPTVVNTDAALENFLKEWVDDWHKPEDFKTDLSDFQFVHTHGPVSPVNRGNDLKDWCDWDNCFNADGKWQQDIDKLTEAGVAPPDFTFMTSKDDSRIINGVRQRAHTDESVVYALPGDVVVLYPFREFARDYNGYDKKYEENYIRWYDFATDGNNPYLDFYTDPQGIYKTDNIGYFGGMGMTNIVVPPVVRISTVDEYVAFVNRVNAGENNLNAVLVNDLDFSGRTDIKPIGTNRNTYPYIGSFDGQGHTLSNMTINMPGTDAIGMFGYVKGPAIIRNFKLENANFTGKQWVGTVGFNNGGYILIENIGFSGNSTATRNASGILGANNNDPHSAIEICNCYVTGSITGTGSTPESAAISGFAVNADIVNCWSTATVTGAEGTNYFTRGYRKDFDVRIRNCYDKNKGNDLPSTPENVNSQEFAKKLDSKYWQVSATDSHVIPTNGTFPNRLEKSYTPENTSLSKDGIRTATIATFYVPENETFDQAVIAADFSQNFIRGNNIDVKRKLIYEPITSFRRIFTIKNGATFAEEFSGSVDNNNDYIRKNRRHIKAPANKQFQIRLDFKMPVDNAGISNVYYKTPDGKYDRVHSFDIEVVDRITDEVTTAVKFAGCGMYYGQGARDGVNIGDGGYKYYRGIRCEAVNAVEGSYMVKLIAKDGSGNRINIVGTSTPLVIAEYELDFENDNQLSFVDEETLKTNPDYAKHTDKYLEETYGKPYTTLDYDQYRVFEDLPNPDNYLYTNKEFSNGLSSKYIKWPKPWDRSTYGFGYNEWHDYNMYVYASHSESTRYHAAADENSAEKNYGIDKGLFDRRFYETGGKEQGYFGYSNAAADPGVIGNLYIDEICDGSTIYGTAWVAEFSSSDEYANIIINFNAELKDGTTHAMKSITTGYIPKEKIGKWMHLYFSFTPNLSKHGLSAGDVVSYHVTIENNCMSSVGADYAIDDIRLYIVKPRATAQQAAPICEDDTRLKVKVETPFEVMLASTGSVEATTKDDGKPNYIYYSFIDKDKYKAALQADKEHQEAYEDAVLKYEYNMKGLTERFGRFSFNSYYEANEEYAGPSDVVGQAAFRETKKDTKERMLVLNTYPKDDELKPGKEYILAFYPSAVNPENADAEVKKIQEDGPSKYFNPGDKCAKFCTFKVMPSDVVKIDGIIVPDLNAFSVCENQSPVINIDLYGAPANGSRSIELLKENANMDWYAGSLTEYKAEKTTDGDKELLLSEALTAFRDEYPDANTLEDSPKGKYTEPMRQYLKTMTEVNAETHAAKLVLRKSSYLFPSVKKTEDNYVVAIPVSRFNDEWILCADPLELKINVGERSPKLMHGFWDATYPEYMEDVPLRIGLEQLKKVSGDKTALTDGTPDNTPTLDIPVRSITPATEGVRAMKLAEDVAVYLVETNDPEYPLLLTKDTENPEARLMEVGALKDIKAVVDGENNNLIRLSFFDSFTFKEGYYYRMRFDYLEDLPADANINNTACSGQNVFTIKVVPEYMQWTGNVGNLNWNNDLNWRRVTSGELLRAQDNTDEFTTDGSNKNTFSYSPLNFTKVIIPAGIDCPHLFQVAGKYTKPADVVAGDATEGIEFDMAANNEKVNVGCVPWYAHTCDQIHFRPNAEISNQQHLTYNRAWAEFEIKPDRWYTLASPLCATVAGDMYLPTADARQSTELFKPITFSTDLNNRFAPAVYQRAWNKATAMVYEINDKNRNVAVKTVWSNVYNDVNEKYAAGTGFSINTDVSRLAGTVDKALFRLPKDDKEYKYYNEDGNIVGNNTTIDRDKAYKLNDVNGTIKVEAGASCRYFLVGNPFMAHIDMAKFLTDNADKINPKYWVLTAGGYAAASKDDSGNFTATIDNPGILAPMQGFFVETIKEATGVELSYTSDMICTHTYESGNSPLHVLSRGDDNDHCLRLTAMADGEAVSQALIHIKPDAVSEYNEREDVAMLDGNDIRSRAKIYTIAGNVAASINTLPEITTTEVGLVADNSRAQTTLRFNGTDAVDGDVMLYDTLTGEATPIYEDMEYTVEGSAVGRLFITASLHGLSDNAIHITQTERTVTVSSSLPVSVNIYDIRGLHILSRTEESGKTSFTLEQGMYIIEARNSDTITRQKIAVI